MKNKMISVLSLFLFFVAENISAQFGQQTDCGIVELSEINEASGIAGSRKNPGVLWVHNDNSDYNRIYAISGKGKDLGIYYLDRCPIRDWEDIAVGPGPVDSCSYIYLGNIGDNDLKYPVKCVYRCVEPTVSAAQTPVVDTIRNNDTLQFVYPDGMHDAEALMVDPLTKDYYVVTKNGDKSIVYRAAYPQPTGGAAIDTLELVDTLEFKEAVAGDISPLGTEIIIKSYKRIYYYSRAANESVKEALAKASRGVSYTEEPQGEGLTWDSDASGYFTISEEDNSDCHLYYYKRIIRVLDRSIRSANVINSLRPRTIFTGDRTVQGSYFNLSGRVTNTCGVNRISDQATGIIVSEPKSSRERKY